MSPRNIRVPVVPIGNSRGIRIPKPLLRQCGIEGDVTIEVVGNTLVIRPVSETPRAGWDERFREMAKHGDDAPLLDDALDLETDGWEW